ncbi:TPA: GIY-YIG nuclease family protein [Salmonella enterica subsp. enterica serovar Waycross]
MPKRLTTEEFIIKAKSVHGDRYDYSRVDYKNTSTKITIICSEHGEFLMSPNSHLSQWQGCSKCAKNKQLNTAEFISRAILVHGDVYDYSKTIYTTSHDKVKIICTKHGIFEQAAYSHLAGKGCKKCRYEDKSASQTHDLNLFIKNAELVHGKKYIYSNVIYAGAHSKVIIKCRKHGEFIQKPNSHLNGTGCPSCAKNGFDKNKDGFVYFLHGGGLIKVGITNDIKRRITELKRNTPFRFELIKCLSMDGFRSAMLEKYFHHKYTRKGLTGFDGATEWLKYSPELMHEIMNA